MMPSDAFVDAWCFVAAGGFVAVLGCLLGVGLARVLGWDREPPMPAVARPVFFLLPDGEVVDADSKEGEES